MNTLPENDIAKFLTSLNSETRAPLITTIDPFGMAFSAIAPHKVTSTLISESSYI